jgi:hypothetical protein
MKKVIATSSNFIANYLHLIVIIIASFYTQPLAAQPVPIISHWRQVKGYPHWWKIRCGIDLKRKSNL